MLIIIARLVLPGSWFRHSSEKYQNNTGTFANSLCESRSALSMQMMLAK